MKKRKAFTLIEIIIALVLLVIALLAMFLLNQSSNKSSMDAYYETIAFSLAREPIEVFRSFGYDILSKISKNEIAAPEPYKVGEEQPIAYDPNQDLQYPAEAENFVRRIDLYNEDPNFIKIRVTVSVKGNSKADTWLSRNAIKLESIIMRLPK